MGGFRGVKMGKRGPKPTPTVTLRLRGSPRAKRRAGEPGAASFGPFDPTPPEGLEGDGAKLWTDLVAQFASTGILTAADRPALTAMCERWSEYVTCTRRLALVDPLGPEASRLARRLSGALDRWMKIAAAFGLTPSDRTKLRVDPPTPRLTGAERFKMANS